MATLSAATPASASAATATTAPQSFASRFAAFYRGPFLAEHQHPTNIACHVVGTTAAVALVAAAALGLVPKQAALLFPGESSCPRAVRGGGVGSRASRETRDAKALTSRLPRDPPTAPTPRRSGPRRSRRARPPAVRAQRRGRHAPRVPAGPPAHVVLLRQPRHGRGGAAPRQDPVAVTRFDVRARRRRACVARRVSLSSGRGGCGQALAEARSEAERGLERERVRAGLQPAHVRGSGVLEC